MGTSESQLCWKADLFLLGSVLLRWWWPVVVGDGCMVVVGVICSDSGDDGDLRLWSKFLKCLGLGFGFSFGLGFIVYFGHFRPFVYVLWLYYLGFRPMGVLGFVLLGVFGLCSQLAVCFNFWLEFPSPFPLNKMFLPFQQKKKSNMYR